MVQAGQSVGCWRPLIEDERRRAAAPFQAALEQARALPMVERLDLGRRKAGSAGHGGIAGHCSSRIAAAALSSFGEAMLSNPRGGRWGAALTQRSAEVDPMATRLAADFRPR